MVGRRRAVAWPAFCLLGFFLISSARPTNAADWGSPGSPLAPAARVDPRGSFRGVSSTVPFRAGPATSTLPPTPPASPLSFIAPVYWSWGRYISSNGRFVLFESAQANRGPGDADWNMDIFVHDRLTGDATVVSRAPDGTPGGDYAYSDAVSADGRYVIFTSRASNLVPKDTNQEWDVFLHDRVIGETTRVSLASDGRQGNGGSMGADLSADGRFLVFISWATNFVGPDLNRRTDVFLRDLHMGFTTLVSRASDATPGNAVSDQATLSSDGQVVAFTSASTNLVGGDINGTTDVFVHDRSTSQTTRVSVASDGSQGNNASSGPSLSADGRYVAFASLATNLVAEDTNRESDVFVHDRLTGETARVSVASDGTQADRRTGWGSLAGDGRFVTFDSEAANLVAGDTNAVADVFVHDQQTGETVRVSFAADGNQARIGAVGPSISADGRYIVFYSGDLGGIVVFDRKPSEAAAWLPTATPPPATPAPTRPLLLATGTSAVGVPTLAPPGDVPAEEVATPTKGASSGRLCGSSFLLPLILLGIAWLAVRRAR